MITTTRINVHDSLERIIAQRFKNTDRYAWVVRNVPFAFRENGKKVSGDIDVLARRWSGEYVVVEIKSTDNDGKRRHVYHQLDKAERYVTRRYQDVSVVHGLYIAYETKNHEDIVAKRLFKRRR